MTMFLAVVGGGIVLVFLDRVLGRGLRAAPEAPVRVATLAIGYAYAAFILYSIPAFFAGWWPY